MPTAAYCSACRAFVFVTADGSCEFGHPRPQLRGLHDADVDRRTGRPKPRVRAKAPRPAVQPVTWSPATIGVPVAPIASPAPVSAPVAVRAQIAVPDWIAAPASPALSASPASVAAAAPGIVAAVAPDDGVIARLLGPPRGRHSAMQPGAALRGRHSMPRSPESRRRVRLAVLAVAILLTAMADAYVIANAAPQRSEVAALFDAAR